MYVRQKIGRQAGAIVEMPYDEAKSNIAACTAEAVSAEEVENAGLPPAGGLVEVPPEQLLADFRIEPNENGGFDLFDAGGVPLNEKPFHNQAAARDAALDHARAMRGMPPRKSGGDDDTKKKTGEPDFDSMTVAELKDYAAEHKIDLGDATLKADILEKVKAAA